MTETEPVDARPGGFCSSCGRALEAGAAFCTHCGAPRVDSTDPDATEIITAAPPEPTRAYERQTYVAEDAAYDEGLVVDEVRDFPWALVLLSALGVLLLLFVLLAAMRRDDDSKVATATTLTTVAPTTVFAPSPQVVAPPPVAAPTPAPSSGSVASPSPAPTAQQQPPATASPQNGGFSLSDLQITDANGTFGGTARIRNDTSTTRSGSFTVRLFRNGAQVGTLNGSASNVGPGSTVTANLTSADKYVDGVDRYEFTASST